MTKQEVIHLKGRLNYLAKQVNCQQLKIIDLLTGPHTTEAEVGAGFHKLYVLQSGIDDLIREALEAKA